MKLLARVRSIGKSLLHRGRREEEISAEIAHHLAARAEDLERRGLSAAEARRRAKVEFGGIERTRASVREAIGLRWFDELRGDLRYAWRMLWRSKGFTAVAVGSLALGIGANTIIFSLAKGVLLDRLAVPHPDQLRFLSTLNGDRSPVQAAWGDTDNKGNKVEMLQFSYPIYRALQQQNREHPVLQDIFSFKFLGDRLTATFNGRAEVVSAQMVSGNYYEQLGVRPQLGRTIQPADDGVAGAGNVVVLSDGVWSRVFGRSPDVIGKTIQLNLIPMTIVGVNPPGFTGAASVQLEPDVFFPLSMQPVLHPMGQAGHASLLDDQNLFWVQVMARVRPDVSAETADAAMQTWLEQDIRGTMKLEKDAQMPKLSLGDGSRGMSEANRDYSMQVYVLAALTGFVLLLACANLANLLLARSAARQREMAVRMALGASRGRVLRQVLTESLLLSLLGGLAGLALGYLGRNIIPHMYNAPWTEGVLRGDFDAAIFAFTAMVSVLTGIFFGMAPAWQAMRTPVNTGLKDAAASATRRCKGMAGRSLVVLQVALSMLLVVGAGLFGTTLHNLYSEKLGFSAEHLFLFELRAPESRYPAPKDVTLHERLEERLARVPGVESLSLSSVPEVAGGGWDDSFEPTDQPERKRIDVMMNNVGPRFFDTYRIPVLFGREFSSADTNTSKLVAVVNETLVRKVWPNASPLGKTFKTGPHDKPQIVEVVGVVGDAKYDNLDRVPPATVYFPYVQADQVTQMTYVVKSSMSAAVMTPLIREAIVEVDRDLPMRDVRTQQAQIDATVSQQKTFAVLSGAFGVLALVLACIGIYGLMAYDVARRTSEIGIRMALGARAEQMMGMVLREASWMAVVGITVGLGGALLLTKYVKSMLFGLRPNDPWVLGGAGLVLFVVAMLAGWGPARRASRVEPMVALRHE